MHEFNALPAQTYTRKCAQDVQPVVLIGKCMRRRCGQIDALLATEEMAQQVESFSNADGQPQLLFFYQNQQISETQKSAAPVLFSPDLAVDRLEGRCIYFVRTVMGDINPDQFESDVSIGEFSPPLFEAIDLILSELHG
jgi:hypothetical protein